MPNVLNVQSRAEYESLSHFLWIFNDLCLYFAVEFEETFPTGVVLLRKQLAQPWLESGTPKHLHVEERLISCMQNHQPGHGCSMFIVCMTNAYHTCR